MIKNTAYIPASRERVFAALTAFNSYPQWVPNCERCAVLSSTGTTTNVEMSLLMSGSRRIRMGVQFIGDPGNTLRFEMVSGKDLKRYSGLYRLVTAADGEGTVLFTDLDVEVAGMPRFITDGPAKKSLDKGAASLKKFIEGFGNAGEKDSVSSTSRRRSTFRGRRLLQIVKQRKGYRIWFMGKVSTVKKIEGNVFNR